MEIEKQLVKVRIAEMIVLMSKWEGNAAKKIFHAFFALLFSKMQHGEIEEENMK